MSKDKPILGLDLDGVLADLIPTWLVFYNRMYNDTLTKEDVTSWNIDTFTKPECGKKIYGLLKPILYESVLPIKGAKDALIELKDFYEIFIVSSCGARGHKNYEMAESKHKWIKRFFPYINEKNFYFVDNKKGFVGDVFVDDYPKNLSVQRSDKKILFDAPHNQNEINYMRAKDWEVLKQALLHFYWHGDLKSLR